MGLFSKIKKGLKSAFKGVKKVVKDVGKSIKKAVTSVGKFMNKIGIVGQIGLALVLPGIGSMLGQWAGSMMAYQGFGASVVNAAGSFLNAAVNIGTKAGNLFKTVTEGVTNVIGETVGAALNKIPGASDLVSKITGGSIDISNKTFKSAFDAASNAMSAVSKAGGDLFSMDTLTATNKYAAKALQDTATKAVQESVQGKIDATMTDELSSQATGIPSIDATPKTESLFGTGGDSFTATITDEATGAVASALPTQTDVLTGAMSSPVSQTVGESVIADSVSTAAVPSLLDRGIDKAKEIGGEYFDTYAKKFATEAAIGTSQKLGLTETPEYTSTTYNAYVPDVDSGDAAISSDPFGQNLLPSVQLLSSSPYGFGARVYSQGYTPDRYAQLLASVG